MQQDTKIFVAELKLKAGLFLSGDGFVQAAAKLQQARTPN